MQDAFDLFDRDKRGYVTAKDVSAVMRQLGMTVTEQELQDMIGEVDTDGKGLVINYGEGGATKWENRGPETFCAHPSRQGKTFRAPPPFKEWKLYALPYNMAKTSSYRVKTTPKLFVPPLQNSSNFFRPPFS